jgi:hypothetical protein
VRTLILLFICALFVGVAFLDGRKREKSLRVLIVDLAIALGLGLAVCWFLVRVVGIFDHWQSPWR